MNPRNWLTTVILMLTFAVVACGPTRADLESALQTESNEPLATERIIIVEVTVLVTTTPLPTLTSSSTPSPTPTLPSSTPPVEEISPSELSTTEKFLDDFENGPNPLWDLNYGELGMSNGKFTVVEPFSGKETDHLALLPSLPSEDMLITIELSPFQMGYITHRFRSDLNPAGAVVLDFKEGQDSLVLFFYPEQLGIEFGNLSPDGQWSTRSGSLVTGVDGNFNLSDGNNMLQIERRNGVYRVFVNSRLVASAADSTGSPGWVGLWFWASGQANNNSTESFAPRIESFALEQLASE